MSRACFRFHRSLLRLQTTRRVDTKARFYFFRVFSVVTRSCPGGPPGRCTRVRCYRAFMIYPDRRLQWTLRPLADCLFIFIIIILFLSRLLMLNLLRPSSCFGGTHARARQSSSTDRQMSRFNKIAIPDKFQMASGQGSHWLIESPTIFLYMCSPPLSNIGQFYF